MFADLRPAFPTGPSVCLGGEGGGGGKKGQQASSLSSKHKLWNFHRYRLVLMNSEGVISPNHKWVGQLNSHPIKLS